MDTIIKGLARCLITAGVSILISVACGETFEGRLAEEVEVGSPSERIAHDSALWNYYAPKKDAVGALEILAKYRLPRPDYEPTPTFLQCDITDGDVYIADQVKAILQESVPVISAATKAIVLNWADGGKCQFDASYLAKNRAEETAGFARVINTIMRRKFLYDLAYPNIPQVTVVSLRGDASDFRFLDQLPYRPDIIGVGNIVYVTAVVGAIADRYVPKYTDHVMMVNMNMKTTQQGKLVFPNQTYRGSEHLAYLAKLEADERWVGDLWNEE